MTTRVQMGRLEEMRSLVASRGAIYWAARMVRARYAQDRAAYERALGLPMPDDADVLAVVEAAETGAPLPDVKLRMPEPGARAGAYVLRRLLRGEIDAEHALALLWHPLYTGRDIIQWMKETP